MTDLKLYNPQDFDASNFNTSPYARRIDKPWGYEIHLVPPETEYMLKIIHINEGARLSLQVHDEKKESWTLLHGNAKVIWEDREKNMIETVLEKGKGYSTEIGQGHRLIGVTDCDILEASTPEKGTTWRLEDDFARPHETPEQREEERRGM